MADRPRAEDLAVLNTERASADGAGQATAGQASAGKDNDGVPLAILATARQDASLASGVADPGPGDHVDRFVVREVLGRGGMGLVLSAHDPRLDRLVAIKLVRPSTGTGASAEVKERLLREARAMAKFRHPNIVSVFEVGEHEGQVFVAMEQVDGGNLREVLGRMSEAGEASWRQVVELFAKAGQGIAAAHAAGMVHRDFKPDNVLIDRNDRVLVSDFGIVSRGGADDSESSDREDLFSQRLTCADEIVGTPAYMAPEQHKGESVDARADQFSFCVALYEALYGHLPFAGDTYLSYITALESGEVRAPAPGRRVPSWLRQILIRGLSVDPAERYESMEALLGELGTDPEQARHLGGRERMALISALAGFAIVWVAAVAGAGVEFTYALHYMTDLGFLGLLVVLAWFARDALFRSDFNRRAFYFLAAVAVSMLVLDAGGQLLGVSPESIGAFHMLVIGTASLASVGPFGPRVLPAVVCYLGGFLGSAAWPSLLLPLLLTGHITASITALALFRTRRA